MDWVIIDGSAHTDRAVSDLLRNRLEDAGKQFAYFDLTEYQIESCRSCGSCGYRTPGRCALRDEMAPILQAASSARVLVVISPVRFGCYSWKVKLVLERLMLLGSPYYTLIRGRIFHASRYGGKSLISIGSMETDLPGEADTFRKLVRRNTANLIGEHGETLVLRRGDDPAARLNSLLEEVIAW